IALVVAVALHRGLEQVGQPDRRPPRRLIAILGLLVGVASAYASSLTILLISGHSAGIGATLWTAARSIVIGVPDAVGGEARSLLHLAGALVVAAIVVVLRVLLAPGHARDGHDGDEHQRAAAIVAGHGDDSI